MNTLKTPVRRDGIRIRDSGGETIAFVVADADYAGEELVSRVNQHDALLQDRDDLRRVVSALVSYALDPKAIQVAIGAGKTILARIAKQEQDEQKQREQSGLADRAGG